MIINFSCINMEHSNYLRNYAENKLHEKVFLLISPPVEAEMIIRAVQDVKFVSCEIITLSGALFYIEFNGTDVHQVIDDVIDRIVLQLNQHETRARALRNHAYENVIDLAQRRRQGSRDKGHHDFRF